MQVFFSPPPAPLPAGATASSAQPSAEGGDSPDSFASMLDLRTGQPVPGDGTSIAGGTPADPTEGAFGPAPEPVDQDVPADTPDSETAELEVALFALPQLLVPLPPPAANADQVTAPAMPNEDLAPAHTQPTVPTPVDDAAGAVDRSAGSEVTQEFAGKAAATPAAANVLPGVRPALVRPEQFAPRPLATDKEPAAAPAGVGATAKSVPTDHAAPSASVQVPMDTAATAGPSQEIFAGQSAEAVVPEAPAPGPVPQQLAEVQTRADEVTSARPGHRTRGNLLPSLQGLRVTVASVDTEPTPVGDSGAASAGRESVPAAASSPVMAAPTLAQVLVESGVGAGRSPRATASVPSFSKSAAAPAPVVPAGSPPPAVPQAELVGVAADPALSPAETEASVVSAQVPMEKNAAPRADAQRAAIANRTTGDVATAPRVDAGRTAVSNPVVERGAGQPNPMAVPTEPSASPTAPVIDPVVRDFAKTPADGVGGERLETPQTAQEKLAAGRGKGTRGATAPLMTAKGQNFLSVERQRVGEDGPGVGTGGAREAQPMSAHTQVLPPASSSLEFDEPAAATAVGSSAANSASGRASTEVLHVRSTAAAAVRETVEAAERAQQVGRNHVELRVQTSDDESLRVHLRWHDGVVHARFITHSTELQQALSREWDLVAPRMAEKGLRFGEASFEQRDQQGQPSSQNAFSFDQQRHSSRGQGQAFEHAEEQKFTLSPSFPAVAAANRRGSAAPTTGAPAPVTTSNTDVRNLRAWA